MICENCRINHEGTYGSGRFCSSKCARGFSTKAKRKEINEKISNSLIGNIPWHKGLSNVYNESTKIKRSNSLKQYFKNNPEEASRRTKGKKKSEETKRKISLSNKGKCGGYRIRGGRGKQGWYKGIFCNSSWELAYLIYCKDYNIQIERNKNGFEYIFENKKYKFYPDFIKENNIFIEVKGYLDSKNKAKIKQFPFKIEIIDKNKIKPYLDYAIKKYGNNFIEKYKL